MVGAIADPLVELDVRTLYLKDFSLVGCTVLEPEMFPNLIRIIEQGSIAPIVYRMFPLEHIPEVQIFFLGKQHVVRIALEI